MPKYLVISYDDDEQQTFYDRVTAKDEDEAKEIIGEIRQYAIPVCAMSDDELIDNGQSLASASEDELQVEIESLKQSHPDD